MKICFLTRHDPYDKKSWSGISYQMFTYLNLSHQVEWIGNSHLNIFEKCLLKIYHNIFRHYKTGFWYYNYLHSKLNVYHIEKKIRNTNFDLIIAPNAPDYIAYLETDVPIIYVNDATFQLFRDLYPIFLKISKSRLKEGDKIEHAALQKSNKIVYSSEWAAESAIKYYKADKNKITVISFGGNLLCEPINSELPLSTSGDEVCELLFIGIDWHRKGGETAIKTLLELRKAGFKCNLTIVGCNPNLKEYADQVVVVPFLDKNIEVEYEQLHDIYLKSHLLLLPTNADCTPVVFSEAAAFGVPVVTSDIGGISSIIHEGVNGCLLPTYSNEIQYANKIMSIFKDKKYYNDFRRSSRHEYETRLNWKIWNEKINDLLNSFYREPNLRKSKYNSDIREV